MKTIQHRTSACFLGLALVAAALFSGATSLRAEGADATDASAPRPPGSLPSTVVGPLTLSAPLRVVTSLSTYAAIARQIVGDRGEVSSIASGEVNPHFVTPRPSLLLRLRRADLFVVTGLDLELWVPVLLDKANNRKIRIGGSGYVTAYTGIKLAEVPTSVNRAEGDIHVFGNPHIWASPLNGILIGRNILVGLKRISPENGPYFEARFTAWKEKVIRALVGDRIVDLLGVDVVFNLEKDHKLVAFLSTQTYQGEPLSDRLGGWLKTSEVFRGEHMVCYHKEWVYFSQAFGVSCDTYIEPKPGIPPSPGHVAKVLALMRERGIKVVWAANYYSQSQVRSVAKKTGATAVIVPASVGGAPGTDTFIDLVNLWVNDLAAAFSKTSGAQ